MEGEEGNNGGGLGEEGAGRRKEEKRRKEKKSKTHKHPRRTIAVPFVVVQHRHAQVVDGVGGEGAEVVPQGGGVLGRGVEVDVGFVVLRHGGVVVVGG